MSTGDDCPVCGDRNVALEEIKAYGERIEVCGSCAGSDLREFFLKEARDRVQELESPSALWSEPSKNPSALWTQGEPSKAGYYLVLVRGAQGHPKGNPWVFLAQVIIHKEIDNGRPVYMDHRGGNGCDTAYIGGKVVAHCEPTAGNFQRAFEEIQSFYASR